MMRPTSFLLSLCLHAGVVALVLFWPQSSAPLVDLSAPVIDVGIYTIGSPGSAPAVPDAPSSPTTPSAPVAPPPTTTPDAPTPPPDTRKPETPPVKPDPVSVPIPPPDEPKPEPPKPEPPKPEPPKPEPPKPETPKPQPPKKSPDQILREALGDLGKQGGGVQGALDDMRRGGNDTSGEGPGGQGGDGIGLVGTYMQSLVSRIRPNWEYAGRADRRNPTALVRISIARDGTITDVEIVTSSGDPAFDGSVLKAVRDTGRVEPPPTPDLMNVRVPFAYEAIRR